MTRWSLFLQTLSLLHHFLGLYYEQAVINYGQEFYRTHRVSSGGFQAALEQLGNQGLVELTMLMGNYALLAFLVNAFDSGLPPDRTEPMLPVL